ncbi:MAG: phospho-N-acetylmuramoyl-pentapeptide-transferase [Sphaerochaetaceae bacterium]
MVEQLVDGQPVWQILRILLALLFSCGLTLVLGKIFIKWMETHKIGQPINPDNPELHRMKEGTPTIGGLFFLTGTTLSALVFGKITQPYSYIPLVAMWGFALIGLLDDVLKLRRHNSVGLKTSQKLAMQILMSALVIWLLDTCSGMHSSVITLPWNPVVKWDIGVWYPLMAMLYVVFFVNAVNISDGLDGLAAGSALPVFFLIGLIAVVFGFGIHEELIQRTIVLGGIDLAMVVSSALGSLLAFLWYNSQKAQVFMGDCGSHGLGALLAVSALLMKIELVVLAASGVFFIECASSLLQIVSIRFAHRKIFLIAPLHHHYEKRGMEESKIVFRFLIASMLCTVSAGVLFIIKYL